MHQILKEQIEKYLGNEPTGKNLDQFLEEVSDTYKIFEQKVSALEGASNAIIEEYQKESQRVQEGLEEGVLRLVEDMERRQEFMIQQRDLFEKFVPKEFAKYLQPKSILDLKLGDQVQMQMSVLFCDIFGFTTIVEKMTPEDSFNFINEYLETIEPSISKNHGFIDKFLGDGVMALFPDPDGALKAALGIEMAISKHTFKGVPAHIYVSIGIHTGSLMLGIIGVKTRMQGTVISDVVNLASRIEGLARIYGTSIIVSEDFFKSLKDTSNFYYRPLGRFQVKGKTIDIPIYEIINPNLKSDCVQQKISTKVDFEKGLKLYMEREFSLSLVYFDKVLKINPNDLAASHYLNLAAQYLVNGPPEDWNGAYVMTIK